MLPSCRKGHVLLLPIQEKKLILFSCLFPLFSCIGRCSAGKKTNIINTFSAFVSAFLSLAFEKRNLDFHDQRDFHDQCLLEEKLQCFLFVCRAVVSNTN